MKLPAILITLCALSASTSLAAPWVSVRDLSPVVPPVSQVRRWPQQLYLNLEGAALTLSESDRSALNASQLCDATLPSFDHLPYESDRTSVLQQLAAAVARRFNRYDLRVQLMRPENPPYVMAVVGGSPELCGLPPGYSGLAPLDCGDSAADNIVLVFSEGILSLEMLAVVIAHEVGHSLGLPHSTEDCDIMSNLLCDPAQKHFIDRTVPVAPDHLGHCDLWETNSAQLLLARLGPRPEPRWRAQNNPQAAEWQPQPRALDALQRQSDNQIASTGCTLNQVVPSANSGILLLALLVLLRTWRRRLEKGRQDGNSR